ncbi:hypothetical protein [Candidatus Parabeggiatoa sp. HSG14]|uniref:hypothetical protein n=1 Tax=Candidatus Parabeggiatoa sp. HSG14 TaxID=3055593 RepID=UPI0025A7F366|nr:hypothetical protein [Thiotrichales bacterium HSG14]
MIEGLTKLGSAKVLGSAFLPNVAILIVGGIIAWQLWENRKYAGEMQKIADSRHKETLTTLKNELDVLTTDKQNLSFKITQLQDNISELEKIKFRIPTKDTPLSTFINETAKPTKDSPKLAMLQKIVEDNVELRKRI